MMSRLHFVLPAAVLVLGLPAGMKFAYGNVKYTKQEKRPCVTCHTTVQGKELNSVGKCYQKSHSLAGCEPKQ